MPAPCHVCQHAAGHDPDCVAVVGSEKQRADYAIDQASRAMAEILAPLDPVDRQLAVMGISDVTTWCRYCYGGGSHCVCVSNE